MLIYAYEGLENVNPPLCEIIRIPETSNATYEAMKEWGKRMGKVSIQCKDTPGFVVNHLLVPYLFEAMAMVEREDAFKEDIDIAMKLGTGYPMGPLELSDYVGLDTLKFIGDGWMRDYPDEPMYRYPKILAKLVDDGKMGIKSGQGFYNYNKE